MSYFAKRRSKLLKQADSAIARAQTAMVDQGIESGAAAAILADARERFAELLPRVPDPGSDGSHLRPFTAAAVMQLAFWLAMKDAGHSALQTWTISERVARESIEQLPSWIRRFSGWLFFTKTMQARLRKVGRLSQEEPLGGWAFEFIEGDDDFDYGVNYTRCGIQSFAREIGAEEIGPYICLHDIAASELLGWGLQRTETIGQGCTRCDFRFRRDAPTEVTIPSELMNE